MSSVYEKKVVETLALTDVICDVCGKSCKTPCGFESGVLSASWGYDSKKDSLKEAYDICESCFDKISDMFIKNRFSEDSSGYQ